MKRVVLNEKSLKKYVREAKKVFPRECYAILLGHETEKEKIVDEFYLPKNQDKWCNPDQILRTQDMVREAKKVAKKLELDVLGDVHSHCYEDIDAKLCDASLSYTDIANSDFVRTNFGQLEPLVGLLILRKPKYRIRAEIIFYPEISIFKVKIV